MLTRSPARFAAVLLIAAAACSKTDVSTVDPVDTGLVEASGPAATIKIVGSSTVAPFSTTVAERFGATSGFATPIVETTGTGGGFLAFCAGVGPEQPSITNASRPIKDGEREECTKNGVTGITEVKIGYDGIVLVNMKGAPAYNLTKTHIFLALAKEIPDGKGGFKANPHQTWKSVDASLPDVKIQMFGPPPTSGTRDAFAELALEKGAEGVPELKALKEADSDAFKERAHTIRTDGAWIDAGENDSAIIQQITKAPNAIGVLGFSFLEQNADRVQAAKLGGTEATFENIASGAYGLSRSMFIYVKEQNVKLVPGVSEFVTEFTSDGAMSEDGYLMEKGLIPLKDEERAAVQAIAAGLAE